VDIRNRVIPNRSHSDRAKEPSPRHAVRAGARPSR
jgi:hypothetical protein